MSKSKLDEAKDKSFWGKVGTAVVVVISVGVYIASGGKGKPPGM